MEILRIIVIAIAGAAFSAWLRPQRPEFSMFIGILCGLICFYMVLEYIGDIASKVETILSRANVSMPFLDLLLKGTAIAYLTQFFAEVCADSGEKAISSKVIFAGKVIILYISLPIFMALFELIISVVSQ